jgi:hypothetical protein
MRFSTTAAALAATTMAVPLLVAGPAAAQESTGGVGGTVWFDRDGDGTRDADEPGAALKRVLLGDGSYRDTAMDGTFTFDGLTAGTHTVTVTTDWAFARTTAETVTVEVTTGGTATVDFGIRGGSVCGTAWRDTDADGSRDADEPGIAGVGVGLLAAYGAFVTTGADGGYCARDLPPGDYTAYAQDRYAIDGTAWTRAIYHVGCPMCPPQDSRVDWRDGSSDPLTITTGPGSAVTEVDGFDVGYVVATGNPQTVQLFVNDPDGGGIRVGDVVDVVGSVNVGGTVPDRLGATLTLPRGLTILESVGGMPSHIDGRRIVGEYPDRRTPGAYEFVVARARVDRPLHNAEITLTVHAGLFGDTDTTDNHLTTWVSASRS